MVMFTDAVETACGSASASSGVCLYLKPSRELGAAGAAFPLGAAAAAAGGAFLAAEPDAPATTAGTFFAYRV